MERKDFLKKVVKFFFSLLTVAVLFALIYVYPSAIRKKTILYVYLMDDDDVPKRGVRIVNYQYTIEDRVMMNRAFLAVTEKGLACFSPICTHLGCFVNWNSYQNEFICPCHGGKYNINGEVIAGPPPRSLTKLPLKIIKGKVYIGITI
ncbi:MAG: ubiquinol-cytochrome c reductase iron-sulfur subunit [Dissulfurispiraceae bacterium]